MVFVPKMLFTFVYDRKNKNHWSLLIIHYSLLIICYSLLGIQTPLIFERGKAGVQGETFKAKERSTTTTLIA